MNETIDSAIRDTLNRNLLKYATGQTMFCPLCRSVLDCRSTVIGSTANGHENVLCGTCFDKLQDKSVYTEIVDGRQLWAAKPAAPKEHKPRAKHTFKERLEAGLQEEGWTRDWTDKSRYNAWRKEGEMDKLFTGPSGALRRGECASRSYSVGDPSCIRPRYAFFLQAGDEALNKS